MMSAFPNPFATSTTIKLNIPSGGNDKTPLAVSIYDIIGNEIVNIFSGKVKSGTKQHFIWNGNDNYGKSVPNGIYIVRASVLGRIANMKLVIIR